MAYGPRRLSNDCHLLERCDLWQSRDLTNPNVLKRTVLLGKLLFTEIE